MKLITKTTYLQFASCSKNAWLQLNKPELSEMFELSEFDKSLVDKGNLVESWARKLFPEGILIKEYGESAHSITKQYLKEKTKVIFQSTFINDKFLARNDVLEYDADNYCWNPGKRYKKDKGNRRDKSLSIEDIRSCYPLTIRTLSGFEILTGFAVFICLCYEYLIYLIRTIF